MERIGGENAAGPRLAAALAAGLDPLVLVAPCPDFTILEANGAAAAVLGLPPPALAGRALVSLLPEGWRSGVMAALAEVCRTGGCAEREFEVGGGLWRERIALAAGVLAVVWREGESVETRRSRNLWRLTEEKFTKAFRNSPDIITISTLEEGRYIDVNEAFERTLGFGREEVIGRTVFDISLWADRADRLGLLEQVRRDGRVSNFEARLRTRSGDILTTLASCDSIELDGQVYLLSMIRDITERKRMEARMRRALEEQELIFQHSTIGITFMRDRRFLRVNAMVGEIFGYPLQELVGASSRMLYPSEKGFQDLAWRGYAIMSEGRTYRGEHLMKRKDGRLIWCSLTGRAVDPADPVRGVIWIIEDVTERRRAHEELRAAKAAAEHASVMKSRFLATMSHELRTPLTSILGFSEIIRDQLFGPVGVPDYADYASDICLSGRHLLDLINDVLDLSKIEAGKFELDIVPFDPHYLLATCIRQARGRAGDRDLQLVLEVQPNATRIWADERAVRQMMLNLLSNAVKFTPDGGRIEVRVREDGAMVWVEVTDTGVGIAADKVERVLEPFEQVDNRYNRSAGGTGLGLALVNALAKLHGGAVRIDSMLNKGTTVAVSLPANPVPPSLPA
ncbi:MAG: PAS domain S-box protein [Rhodospirillaceae bacterium]